MQKQSVNVSNYLLQPESIAEVPDNFRCVHCRELRIPVYQKMACGCRSCEPCLYQHKDKAIACPGPSEECISSFLISADPKSDILNLKDVFTDIAAKREILKLIIHCPFKDSGCQETGPVRHVLDTHFDQCPFKPQMCPDCNEAVGNIQEHKKSSCPMRMVKCQFCEKSLMARDLDDHYDCVKNRENCCEKNKYECPFCHGSTKFLKSEIQNHFTFKCPNKPQFCAFEEIGCKEFNAEDELKKHCKQHVDGHLEKFLAQFEMDTFEAPEIQEEISILYSRADFLASKVFNMAALHHLRDTIKKRLQETGRLPQSLLSESAGASLPVEASSEHLLRIKSQHEQLTASLNKSGKLLWIFTDFERKQRSGTFFDSETFYTDPMGYRLRIRCYPKGNGRAMGQFFSLYFAIVHGEYDDLLEWPMRLNVTLEILPCNDNSGVLGSRSKRQTYCMGVDQEPFKKPLPNEVNTAVGNPRFLPLAELSNYLKNDKLHIQCRVART